MNQSDEDAFPFLSYFEIMRLIVLNSNESDADAFRLIVL